MIRPRAAISWSGGKDSLAAVAATRERLDLVCALTMFDESGGRSRSHGLRPELVAAQAQRLGLRSVTARCSWSTYNDVFTGALRTLAQDGITHVVFGQSARSRWEILLKGSTLNRFLEEVSGAAVQVVPIESP